MLNIDTAIRQLREICQGQQATELINLEDAQNRVVAADILAPVSLPPFNSSAMDGYALIAPPPSDENRVFHVIGTSFAGRPFTTNGQGDAAVRIFTGAAVPDWADAVVLQEDVERTGDTIKVHETIKQGANIRYIGHDIDAEELLLHQGEQLGAFEISWLAACGVQQIEVYEKVTVALFSTGDELQDPGEPLQHGQIYDSNRTALKQLLRDKPVSLIDLGCLPDDPTLIESELARIADKVNLIVTSGGVSVGDADFVRPAVEKLGTLAFWNVALKPGKPIAVGKIKNALFLGLPGNPVSTVITYLLFVDPAVDALSNLPPQASLLIPAELTEKLSHSKGRREYQRGILTRNNDRLAVKPTGDQSSNRLATLAKANCLILVPEEREGLAIGESVDVLMLPKEAHHLVNEPPASV